MASPSTVVKDKINTNDDDQSIIRKELEEFALKSQQEKQRKKELEEKVIK